MFANKVVLITGGSSGIGAVTAEQFAKEGAALAIVGRNETKLQDVAKRCKELGAKILTIKADISKDDEARTIVKQTIDELGQLDVLVNNAGIVKFATIHDSNLLEVYDEIMNTNLRPVVHITNLAVPYLKETKGNIVNVSGISSDKVSFAGFGSHCISKAGMDQFTKSAAFELASFGVRVNSVNPGPVKTDIGQKGNLSVEAKELKANLVNMTALGRMSEPEEIGDLILYLASEKGRSITGSCFVIDNGSLLK